MWKVFSVSFHFMRIKTAEVLIGGLRVKRRWEVIGLHLWKDKIIHITGLNLTDLLAFSFCVVGQL